ncbi:MAG: pilus assembly protein [Alphaproteobacteria bacterium]|nr:pilus assembly protein [Alphaproteobacteria bacterium]
MRAFITTLCRDNRAASAAEFAIVLPLLLLFLVGMLDVGRLMWTWNRAEKATQMGVRYAVATEMIPVGLASYSFTTSGGIPQGDPIPQSSFGGATCSSSGGTTSCLCNSGATCPPLGTANDTAFDNIVNRMQAFLPELPDNNITVEYGYSGLGYAGDPNGSDVSPLVTVRIQNMTFQPITLILFNTSITLPSFSAALTLEDGSGNVSN